MTDISMCHGILDGVECPVRSECYRFTATPDKYVQSYFDPCEDYSEKGCNHFWKRRVG
jgi:hypothetical protein